MMNHHVRSALATACVLALGACGGGSDGDTATPEPPAPTTTAVTVTAMDGLLQNAKVCLDVNANGRCDEGEPNATTGANGQATLNVPNAQVGGFAVLAEAGTGTTDADSGPVTQPYVLTAPADRTAVISPWSTIVEQVRRSTAVTTAQAEATVQSLTGLSVSPLSNYSGAAAGSETAALAVAARVLVASMQQQVATLTSAGGQTDAAGGAITAQGVLQVVQAQLLENLPAVMAAAADATQACTTPGSSACALAVAEAVGDAPSVNPASLPSLAAAARLAQEAIASGGAGGAVQAGYSLEWLNFTDANNWYYRAIITSAAGAIPDAQGLTHYRDERKVNVGGTVTPYAWVGSAARQGDTHWNGTAWVSCGVDEVAGSSTVRDAKGVSTSDFCNGRSVSKGTRVVEAIAGKSMADIVTRIRVGRPNATGWGPEPALLGTATFSGEAALLHQWFTDLSAAITYDVRTSNQVGVYTAEVSAGGDTRSNTSLACWSSANWGTQPADSLEQVVSRYRGTPCTFNQASGVYNGTTLYSADPQVWTGQSTVSIGVIGTQAVGASPRTAFYTDNRLIRVAFTGEGQATYYSCLQRWDNGTPFNCDTIGTGTYTVSTLGDARILRFGNLPAATGELTYERVFVERGGKVYFGFQNKLRSYYVMRLNRSAGDALMSTLGMPAVVVP